MGDTVRIQPYERQWETLGSGLYRGVEPRDISAVFDVHGPITMGFTLGDIDVRLPSLELAEFTPIELFGDNGAEPAWGGRLIETPGRPGGLTVSAEGWQQHLSDDSNPFMYVYEGLDAFVDWRAIDTVSSAGFNQAGMGAANVEIGTKIRIGFPNATVSTVGSFAAAVIDLGEGKAAKRIALTLTSSFNSTHTFYCIGHDTIDWRESVGREDLVSAFANNNALFGSAGDPYQFSRAAANPHRYWTLMYYSATTATYSNDTWFDVLQFQAAVSDAYLVAGDTSTDVPKSRSALTATLVFKDQLARCALLSRDYSRIATTSFFIRSLGGPGEEAVPREGLERADSYHRYRWGVDALRRGYFQPQPATPTLVVNTKDNGVEYEDASINNGADIRNKVIVTGRSGSGIELRREKLVEPRADQITKVGVPQHANPSATVNVTGWTFTLLSGGATSFVRDTASFKSSPAAFKMDNTSLTAFRGQAVGAVASPLPGAARIRVSMQVATTYGFQPYSFERGKQWWRVKIKSLPSGTLYTSPRMQDDARGIANSGGFIEKTFDFFHPPGLGDTSFEIQIEVYNYTTGVPGDFWFDDVALSRVVVTQPDRLGFPRSGELQAQAATDLDSMDLLADLYLASHSRAPFSVTGPMVYDRLAGHHLTPLEVCARTGELIELADVVDPISGQNGRIVQIVTGTYNSPNRALLALDEDRARYEALQARMAVVQGR